MELFINVTALELGYIILIIHVIISNAPFILCVSRHYKAFANKVSTDPIRRSSNTSVLYSEGVQLKFQYRH